MGSGSDYGKLGRYVSHDGETRQAKKIDGFIPFSIDRCAQAVSGKLPVQDLA
jgi:hypothetical protein